MPGFIQITDTHIVAPGALAYGRSDTAPALRAAVATINAHLPRLPEVECVIVTGDLTDHGTDVEYAHFREIMALLGLPWLAVPGNHDSRAAMRAACADAPWCTGSGPIQWQRDFGAFSLIGLDTLLDGAHHGSVCEEGFAFLDRALEATGDRTAVIATHRMPILALTSRTLILQNGRMAVDGPRDQVLAHLAQAGGKEGSA